jgi:hypothetical protein
MPRPIPFVFVAKNNSNLKILRESQLATDLDVNKIDVEYILSFCPNEPSVGYNRWPKLTGRKKVEDYACRLTNVRCPVRDSRHPQVGWALWNCSSALCKLFAIRPLRAGTKRYQ